MTIMDITTLLPRFLHAVHDPLFGEFPLWLSEGQARGRVFKNEVGTEWLPVATEHGRGDGWLARTTAVDATGAAVPVERLFSLLRDDGLVRLDRFCRTLHVLNRPADTRRLYLPIHPDLPASVSGEHGQVFERVLSFLEVPPARITIVLPAAAARVVDLAERVTANYRRHGYGVVWEGPPTAIQRGPDGWLSYENGGATVLPAP